MELYKHFSEQYKGKTIGRRKAVELAEASAELNGAVYPSHLIFAINLAYGASGERYPKTNKLSIGELFKRLHELTTAEGNEG